MWLNNYYIPAASRRGMPESETDGRNAMEKQLSIIDALDALGPSSLNQITAETGLVKSTVHHHLQILYQNGYVARDGEEYDISFRFLEIGNRKRLHMELFEVARPEIDTLAQETDELALLIVEEEGLGAYVYKSIGDKAVDLGSELGKQSYLNTTAPGKAILAFLPEERVDEIIERHGLHSKTDNTISDREQLYEELEMIREEGVAYDDEESLEGYRCVSVPIISNDKVRGAISVAGPTSRFRGERYREELPETVQKAANLIELDVTYS